MERHGQADVSISKLQQSYTGQQVRLEMMTCTDAMFAQEMAACTCRQQELL